MAIKGKNKSRSRSGAARKRPTAPPRPAAAPSRATPWYRTMGGQLALIVGLLAIIGLVMWRVSVASSESTELEGRQDKLKAYTSEVGTYVGQIQETVREMLGAPFNTANPEAIDGLEESTDRWVKNLEETGAMIQALVPPEDLVPLNVTLQQAFLTYGSSAKIYALIPGESSNKRIQALIDRAAEVREQAGVVMGSALGMLDQERRDAELGPSGIDVPAQMTPIIPSPAPIEDDDKGAGNGEKKNDG